MAKIPFMQLSKAPPLKPGEPYPLFTRLSIETTSTCNRDCHFCCVRNRPRKLESMDDALYSKIVQELSDLRWDGVVQLFLVNEPLLDKKLVPRVQELRTHVPKCTIHVTSNGEMWEALIRKEQWKTVVDRVVLLLRSGVNALNISAYESKEQFQQYLELKQRVREVMPEVEHGTYVDTWKKVGPRRHIFAVTDMTDPQGLHDWGDDRIREEQAHRLREYKGGHCARPARHLVLRWDGDIMVCCAMDPSKAERFGNVRDMTLLELWNSDTMNKYRYWLGNKRRIGDCSGCRETMAYPFAFRRVEGRPEWDVPESGISLPVIQ